MNEIIIIDGVKYLRADTDKKVVTELTDEQVRVALIMTIDNYFLFCYYQINSIFEKPTKVFCIQ